jgi:hypothetical protein
MYITFVYESGIPERLFFELPPQCEVNVLERVVSDKRHCFGSERAVRCLGVTVVDVCSEVTGFSNSDSTTRQDAPSQI